MIQYIHFSRVVAKQLEALHKSGKKGELAAQQGERIIRRLKMEGPQSLTLQGKRTKHGEYRIANCVKYDLGNGYRLVTIRQGSHLLVSFAGSHDKTDQWIERHRHNTPQPYDPSYTCTKMPTPVDGGDRRFPSTGADDHGNDDPYEDFLQTRINDSTLKSIFHGLIQNRGS